VIPLGNKNIQPDARDLRLLLMMDNATPETMEAAIVDGGGGVVCDIHCEDTRNWFAGEGTAATIGVAWDNIGIGYNALNALSTGFENVVIGSYAGEFITTGFGNVLIGKYAGNDLTDNNNYYNTMVGTAAGVNASGNQAYNNSYFGYYAGRNVDGADNTFIGYKAGNGGVGYDTCEENVIVGAQAGEDITEAARNVILGSEAGDQLTDGAHNILIGYTAGHSLTTQDYLLYIHSSNDDDPTIHGELDNRNVGVCGVGTDQYADGVRVFAIHEASTNPSGAEADTCILYVDTGELWVHDAAGNQTQLSSHIEDEWVHHDRLPDGQERVIWMERLVKAVEVLTGQTFTETRAGA